MLACQPLNGREVISTPALNAGNCPTGQRPATHPCPAARRMKKVIIMRDVSENKGRRRVKCERMRRFLVGSPDFGRVSIDQSTPSGDGKPPVVLKLVIGRCSPPGAYHLRTGIPVKLHAFIAARIVKPGSPPASSVSTRRAQSVQLMNRPARP